MDKLAKAIKAMEENPTYREKHCDLLVKRFEEAVKNNKTEITADRDKFTECAFKVIRLLLPERKFDEKRKSEWEVCYDRSAASNKHP